MVSKKVPRHVALIPDGNRRWAKENGLVATAGHVKAGSYDNVYGLFKQGSDLGVECMSFWGFSTENWKRDKSESDVIFNVISKSFKKLRKDIHKDKIKFRHVGRRDRLPEKLVKEMEELEDESKDYSGFCIIMCLDYGGRDEIVRAVNKTIENGVKVNEKSFLDYLDTAGLPDPDLVIRTGGDLRLSGFMPYQGNYAELVFSKKLFPDFRPKDLSKAVKEFGKKERRFGGN